MPGQRVTDTSFRFFLAFDRCWGVLVRPGVVVELYMSRLDMLFRKPWHAFPWARGPVLTCFCRSRGTFPPGPRGPLDPNPAGPQLQRSPQHFMQRAVVPWFSSNVLLVCLFKTRNLQHIKSMKSKFKKSYLCGVINDFLNRWMRWGGVTIM